MDYLPISFTNIARKRVIWSKTARQLERRKKRMPARANQLKRKSTLSAEILVFDVYKIPLLLCEARTIDRTMLISFLDRQNSENSFT